MKKLILRAGKRDTVASIAKRYRTSPAMVAQWNHVASSASFRPGSSITVMVPGKAARRTTTARAGRASKAVAAAPRGGKKAVVKGAAPRARLAKAASAQGRKPG